MKRILLAGAVALMITGCVTAETILGTGENNQNSMTVSTLGLQCLEGNCSNGEGRAQEDCRKYMAIHQGEFKDGKLWDGEVIALRGGSSRVIKEIIKGSVVYDSSKEPLR